MTIFRNSPTPGAGSNAAGLLAAALLTLALLVSPVSAWAQNDAVDTLEGGGAITDPSATADKAADTVEAVEKNAAARPPRSLISPTDGASFGTEGGPLPVAPAGDRAAVADVGPDGVSIGALAILDPAAVGLLDEVDGSLGADMWAGSRRPLIEHLISLLPVEGPSPAMQDLARRLLLSRAAVPEGRAGQPGLLVRRVERLIAAGLLREVGELLGRPGGGEESLALSDARIEALLLSGNLVAACAATDGRLGRDESPRWLKVAAFCRHLNGDEAGAGLAADVMREQGEEQRDEIFFALFDRLQGFPAVPGQPGPDRLTPLTLAMLRTLGDPIPLELVEGAAPSMLQALLGLESLDLDIHLRAAERAESMGVIPTQGLVDLYRAVAFAPEQMNNALTTAAELPGPRAMALLHQAAYRQSVPVVRAEILQTAFRLAAESGNLAAVSRLNLESLGSIKPASELGWFAAEATRGLLIGGDAEAAEAWLGLLRSQAAADADDLLPEMIALWPLFRIAGRGHGPMWPEAPLRAWVASLEVQGTGQDGMAGPILDAMERRDLVEFVLTVLQAFGEPIPEDLWEDVLSDPLTVESVLPVAPVWRGLAMAAAEGRTGETALMSLLALDTRGPVGAHPVVLSSVILSLRAVGLEADARRIAFEAALGRGL